MIYILAGNFEEASCWARQNKVPYGEWRYIYDANQLYGLMGGQFIRIGSWIERRNALEIRNILIERGFSEVSPSIFSKEV